MGAPLNNLTWGSLGSLLATAVVVRTAVHDVLPAEAHAFLRSLLSRAAAAAFSPPRDAIIINETDANGVPNELYDAAQLYLGARCLATASTLHLHKTHGGAVVASLPDSHATHDTFRGRGYLLHGPPGTGKTSLVAAMANLLEFDIYDLELTTVSSNHELRRLLASTRPKSVIVVEDVDCSLALFDRTRSPHSHDNSTEVATQLDTISLSGVLNFVDGLWPSCVGERLIVFTTNHIDRLDPALLRPGRMDRKIELGYCKAPALRVLAKNYLAGDGEEDDEEELMGEAARLLEEVEVTPADVAEVFMGCDGDEGAHLALRKLVDELNRRAVHGPV
uniref:AAA+ ATPase domain-containing protein n=1 Tax=Leersia perrieri TaxID=77586 RepID=A0A0D9UWH0_9ORYZ